MTSAEPRAARSALSGWPAVTASGPTVAVPSGSTALAEAANRWLEKAVARAGLFSLGTWFAIGAGVASSVTIGDIVAILLVPIWITSLRRYRGAVLFACAGLLALASGLALSKWARIDHNVSSGIAASALMLLLGIICGAGFVLWSRGVLTVSQIGVWYGLGLLTDVARRHHLALTTDGWKHGFAVAAGVLVLAVAHRMKLRRTAELVALAALAILSIGLGARSYFATFLLTLMVIAWLNRPRTLSHRASWTWTAALLGGLAIGIYYLGSTLLVNGYLGRAAQAKSVEQIDTAGSLILGGRPELGATLALFKERPWGFGAGVIANSHDIGVAKAGLADLHYDPNNGYVDRFMFGGQIELHSTLGDVWANFGIAGLLLIALIALLVVRGLALSIAEGTGSALLVFFAGGRLWNLTFSPFLSAAPSLLLALGLALPRRVKSAPLGAHALRPRRSDRDIEGAAVLSGSAADDEPVPGHARRQPARDTPASRC